MLDICWETRRKEGEGSADLGWNRGQYSDAVLNELESQNDGQVEGIMGKVRQLKDVRTTYPVRMHRDTHRRR